MIEFFHQLSVIFHMFVDYIVPVFKNFIFLLQSIPKAMIGVSNVVSLLPPFITVPIFAFLGLSLLISILNHWG